MENEVPQEGQFLAGTSRDNKKVKRDGLELIRQADSLGSIPYLSSQGIVEQAVE